MILTRKNHPSNDLQAGEPSDSTVGEKCCQLDGCAPPQHFGRESSCKVRIPAKRDKIRGQVHGALSEGLMKEKGTVSFQRINIRDDRRRPHVARRIAIRAECIELCTVLNARDDVAAN